MPNTCRFCLANGLLSDHPLFENDAFYVLGMLDHTRRHGLMVVLKRHAETPFEITATEWPHIAEALTFAKSHLARFAPSGFSIGWNVGATAGQHVAHVHLHIICRFENEPATGLGINGLLQTVNGRPNGAK